MGFCTTPITVEQAIKFVEEGGAVVSASKVEYFDNNEWLMSAASAEIKDDSDFIIIILHNGDFVEFSSVHER